MKASHLAPLDRKDRIDSTRNQPWNPVAHGTSRVDEKLAAENATPSITPDRVCNVQEFTREWRKLSQEPLLHRYQ